MPSYDGTSPESKQNADEKDFIVTFDNFLFHFNFYLYRFINISNLDKQPKKNRVQDVFKLV
jgi:hypothetical protein